MSASAVTPSGSATAVAGWIAPEVHVESEAFWEGIATGEVRLQECDACGHRFVPMPGCPRCGAPTSHTVVAPSTGTLYTWTVVQRALDPTFQADVPYIVALVEFDGGGRIPARVIDADPGQLAIGDALELCFIVAGGHPCWAFRPAAAVGETG